MVMKAYALAQLQEYLPLRLICTMSMYVLFICSVVLAVVHLFVQNWQRNDQLCSFN